MASSGTPCFPAMLIGSLSLQGEGWGEGLFTEAPHL